RPRPRWPDAECEEQRSAESAERASSVEFADNLATQQQRMGGREHHPGRNGRAGCDSEVKGGGRNRNRGVSTEQGGDVMRVLEGAAAQKAIDALANREPVPNAKIEKTVAKIVGDVRK